MASMRLWSLVGLLAFQLGFLSPAALAAAWDGYGRSMPSTRYERDEGALAKFSPGKALKAFAPYQDPPFSEALALPNPLREPRFQSYQVIVVINKLSHPFWGRAQTLRVYLRGQGLIRYWLISTGGKGFETPSGYFVPQGFSSRHWSSRYDAPMLWAVFFNSGISLHSSLDRGALRDMGRAATSHGCVRIEDHRAEELYHLIGHSGYGPVDRLDRNGLQVKKKGQAVKLMAYKTLIVVAPTRQWGTQPSVKKPAKVNVAHKASAAGVASSRPATRTSAKAGSSQAAQTNAKSHRNRTQKARK